MGADKTGPVKTSPVREVRRRVRKEFQILTDTVQQVLKKFEHPRCGVL